MSQSPAVTPPNPELAVLPNLFLLDPKNRAFVEGKSRRVALERHVYLIPLLLALLTLGLLIYAVIQWNIYAELVRAGVRTHAVVTGRQRHSDEEGAWYSVTYSFTAEDGRTYTASSSVSERISGPLWVGARVEVIYLPADPNVSKTVGREREDVAVSFVLASTAAVWSCFTVSRALWLHLRAGRWTAKGQLLKGEVVAWRAKEVSDADDIAYRVELHYVFDTPDRRRKRVVKKMKMTPKKYLGYCIPKPGTPIAVLYVDHKHYQVL